MNRWRAGWVLRFSLGVQRRNLDMPAVNVGTGGVDDQTRKRLAGFLGLESSNWMMSPSERIALVGLLELLRPKCSLEVGYAYGGSTELLSRYSREVHAVDVDERVLECPKRFNNVTPLHSTSAEAFKQFLENGRRFDFCLLDGDHSGQCARDDLRMAVKVADVIIVHDCANPECRAGYEEALAECDVYANLDWIDGRIQVDGPWGGFGIVVTSLPKNSRYGITPIAKTGFQLIREHLDR